MWIQPGALPRVPAYAVVPLHDLESALRGLAGAPGDMPQPLLDAAFKRLERVQPELAAFLSYELSNLDGQSPQAVLYLLLLVTFQAFEAAFGLRLRRLEKADINAALEQLIVDSEIRSESSALRGFSEDVIAIAQPALMRFVNDELEQMQPPPESVPSIMEAVLVAVLALQSAVAPA